MIMNTGTHSTNDPKAAARPPRADDLVNTAEAYSAKGSQSLPPSDSATPGATTATNNALMDQQHQIQASPNKSLFRRRRYLVPAGGVLLIIALLGGFAPRLSKSKIAATDTQQLAV